MWIVALCLLAAACTSTRLGYESLPTVAAWRIERDLDLDSQQKSMVLARLDEAHRWHRRTQLPQYSAFLRRVEERLREPVGAAEVAGWRAEALAAWVPVAEHLAPGLAELARTLRPEQIDALAASFAEQNREWRADNLPASPAARAKLRADRHEKRAEFFFGSLTREQRREIRALAEALPAPEEAWLAEREARQRAFVALLRRIVAERPAQELATAWCREYLAGLWTSRDAARAAELARLQAADNELTAQVLNRAGPAQRSALARRLRGFSDDFVALAGLAAGRP